MTRSRLLEGCAAAGGAPPGVVEPFSLRLEGAAIAALGGGLSRGAGEEAVDLAGAYLVPGLVDAHVHLGLGTGEEDRRAGARDAGRIVGEGVGTREEPASREATARRHLSAGVTVVRDLGGGGPSPAGEPSGRAPGPGWPRVIHSRGALTRRGRYGSFLGTALAPGEDLAAAVRGRARAGAGVIKVILTGSVDFERGTAEPPHFSSAELRLMIEVAHSLGLPVAVHANGAQAVRLAAEAGADSVEHGILADESALEALASNGCVWVPTLTPLQALADTGRWPSLPRIMAAHEEMVGRGDALGLRIAAGTDAGSPGVPHGSLLTEVGLLRRAGLSPAAARAAATSVGADLLRLPAGFGRLAVGAVTDLVWFECDPFAADHPATPGSVRPLGMLRASTVAGERPERR